MHLAVREAVKQDGAGREPVSASAADLLIEGLDRGWQSIMHDRAHVCLVDAHAEGDGGDHDFKLAGKELCLHALAGLWRKTRMVGGGRELAA